MTTIVLENVAGRVEAAVRDEEEGRVENAVLSKRVPAKTGDDRFAYGFTSNPDFTRQRDLEVARESRLKQIGKYRKDALALEKQLEKVGIKPIATITTTAWYSICKSNGLFMLQPNRKGYVRINNNVVSELRGKSDGNPNVLMSIAMFVGCIAGLAAAVAYIPDQWAGSSQFMVGAISVIGSTICTALLTGFAYSFWSDHRFEKAVDAWLKGKSWKDILLAVSYQNHHTGIPCLTNEGSVNTRITLPPAPVEVIGIVERFQELHETDEWGSSLVLRVMAEPDAISFDKSIKEIFKLERERQIEWERAIAQDPILFVQNGSAVAVLAQYGGNLKWEEKAIDDLINSEHLL